ncbi:MAG TPA: hypothetical protein VFY93_17195 [Planctomycetota bacterium]|nr:hypothetical protein [Planctomycetota bacterium]
MTRTFALLMVAALAACGSTVRTDKGDSQWAPKFERAKVLYEVNDEKTGARVGYVEKTTYEDGKVVYWVANADRNVKLGYMTSNNRGYRYEWVAGVRSEEPEFIGADTYQANARRILGYDHAVTLKEIPWEALLKQYEAPAGGGKKE